MVERQRCEGDRPGLVGGREIRPQRRIPEPVERRLRRGVGHDHDRRERRQARGDLAQLGEAVMRLAVVVIPVDGEQHLGLDLAEAVDDALHAEIRRAGRPHGADARRREHGDDRLGHVRQIAGDAVARLDAHRRQRLGEPRDFGVQLGPGDRPLDLVLAPEDQGRRRVVPAQQVLREVEPGLREEPRAGHPVRMVQRDLASLADDPGEKPHGVPEVSRMRDGPAP
jgi:hypothetical protein